MNRVIDYFTFKVLPETWLPVVLSVEPVYVRLEIDKAGKIEESKKWYTLISVGHLDRLVENAQNPERFLPTGKPFIAGQDATEEPSGESRFVWVNGMKGVCVMMEGSRYRELLDPIRETDSRALSTEMLHQVVAQYRHRMR